MQPTPHIGVVLLCGKEPASAREAKAALPASGMRAGTVWGCAEEGSETLGELQALFGKERLLLTPPGTGKTARINQGARAALEAGADFVLLLEEGVILAPGALTVLLISLEAQKRAGAVCPALLPGEGEDVALCGGRFSRSTGSAHLLRMRLLPEDTLARQWSAVDFPPSACALLRRECVEEVGFFHEAYGSTGFEAEWGQRATKECWETLCVPKAQAICRAISPEEPTAELAHERARTPFWLLKGWGRPVQRMAALPVAMLVAWPLSFLSHTLRGRFRCAGAVVRGSFAGIFQQADPREGGHLAVPLQGRRLRLFPPSTVREQAKYL